MVSRKSDTKKRNKDTNKKLKAQKAESSKPPMRQTKNERLIRPNQANRQRCRKKMKGSEGRIKQTANAAEKKMKGSEGRIKQTANAAEKK